MKPDDIKSAREQQRKLETLVSDYQEQEYGPSNDLLIDIFEAACHVKDYLTMALKELEAERAQCCKDVCPECRWDLPIILGKEFRHELKNYRGEWYSVLCSANAIRQRAARDSHHASPHDAER